MKASITIVLLFLAAPLMGQWSATPGPNGGTVTAFASLHGYLFAGGASEGVFRSSDDGATWTLASSGLINTGVWTLAVLDTVLFAGTYGGGVFRSRDEAATWEPASDGITNLYVLSMASDGQNLYAGTLGGLFRTSDGGTSWTVTDSGMTTTSVRSLAVFGSIVFAGTYGGGIYTSSDQGDSWTNESTGLTNLSILNFARIGSNLFTGTYGGMFHSTNWGEEWRPMTLDVTNPASSGAVPEGTVAPKAVYTMAVSGTNLFVGTYGAGVFKSVDNGASWLAINDGLGDLFLNLVAIEGSYLYAGTLSGQVWRRPLSDLTAVHPAVGAPLPKFRLEQNFPNPFNPTTSITYDLPGSHEITLGVYDLLGRTIRTLAAGRREAGPHTVRFDAEGLASGAYLYRLQSGGLSQTRIMILTR